MLTPYSPNRETPRRARNHMYHPSMVAEHLSPRPTRGAGPERPCSLRRRCAMNRGNLPPSLVLRRLTTGYQVTQAIHVAAKLGLADLLADGPRTSDALAAATGTHPDALYRLLRALSGVGVFREEEGRRFALTDLGACLRSEASDSLAGWAAYVSEPYHWQAWGAREHSVR